MVEVVKELTREERKLKDTITKELSVIRKTGSLVIGFRRVMKEFYKGNLKLVIMASDTPEDKALLIKYYSKLANIPLIIWPDDVKSLGEALGRPHIVSVVGILDPGASGILDLVKQS